MTGPALAARAFSSYPIKTGLLARLDQKFPSYLSAWSGSPLRLDGGDTHFGYVIEGRCSLVQPGRERGLVTGDVFSCAGEAMVIAPPTVSGAASGVVISREAWLGFNYVLGPIERKGRLKYIDGCTDSLLIPPVRMGDPCMNLLYFPAGIDQTAHTHPSERIGIILSGRGRCHRWDETTNWKEGLVDLTPGMIFAIHTDGKHKFSTPYDEEMRVLAYHPESDFGPRDEDHPMLNRTIVDGVSARDVDAIRTK